MLRVNKIREWVKIREANGGQGAEREMVKWSTGRFGLVNWFGHLFGSPTTI